MRHTKAITRKPAKAQSAYASKLLFKQEASSLIALNTAFLVDDFSLVLGALFTNALSLGTFISIVFGDNTTS
jgi:hypothetical protein